MMTDQRLQEIDAGDVPEQRAIDECVTEIRRLRVEVEQAQQERDAATRREEESSAAQHARAERLQSVRDDCVRNEAALIADRDAWKEKADAAEQRLAEFNAYLADAPTVGRQCPLCRADAELPPLPDKWHHTEGPEGPWAGLPWAGLVEYKCADTNEGVRLWPSGDVQLTGWVNYADLLIVLRHAERAHQNSQETQ